MFYPQQLAPYYTEKSREIDYSHLCGQWSGLIYVEKTLSTSTAAGSSATTQSADGYLNYSVDVNNNRLIPTDGSTGSPVNIWFIPGRFTQSLSNITQTVGIGDGTVLRDSLLLPFPEKWYPSNYPFGTAGTTPIGPWNIHQYNPINLVTGFYYLRNNTAYASVGNTYLFREERVLFLTLGNVTPASTIRLQFFYNDTLMTPNLSPTRVRSGGLDKNVIINSINRFKNQVTI